MMFTVYSTSKVKSFERYLSFLLKSLLFSIPLLAMTGYIPITFPSYPFSGCLCCKLHIPPFFQAEASAFHSAPLLSEVLSRCEISSDADQLHRPLAAEGLST